MKAFTPSPMFRALEAVHGVDEQTCTSVNGQTPAGMFASPPEDSM
jgi:hypothetical protein